MGNNFDAPFRHVTPCAIVGGSLRQTLLERQSATLVSVAGETPATIVGWSLSGSRLKVGVVTAQTTKPPSTLAEAFAERHGRIVLKQIFVGRGLPIEWQTEDRDCIVKRGTGPKVKVVFSRMQYSGAASLVTIHADVVSQPCGQSCRVDDRGVPTFDHC